MLRYRFLLSFFSISCVLSAFSQSDTLISKYDTLEPRRVKTDGILEDSLFNNHPAYDNTLADFQLYQPVIRNTFFDIGTGNIGGPIPNLFMDNHSEIGFQSGINSLNIWNVDLKHHRHTISKVPYTRVRYIFGANKENVMTAEHAQTFGKALSAGFEINRISSEGFMANQKNTATSGLLYLRFNNLSGRYKAYLSGSSGNNKNVENGGFKSDQSTEINLTQANTRWRYSEILLKQSFALWQTAKDTMDSKTDSLTRKMDMIANLKSLTLENEVNYKKQRFAYFDNATDSISRLFYPTYLKDSIIRDSSYLRNLSASLFVTYKSNSVFFSEIKGGLKMESIAWNQEKSNLFFLNSIIFTNLDIFSFKTQRLNVGAQIIIGGYNAGDYRISFSHAYKLKNDAAGVSTWTNSIEIKEITPDLIYKRWQSTHFFWDQILNKTKDFSLKTELFLRPQRFGLLLKLSLLQNLYFLNNQSLPESNGIVPLFLFKTTKDFRLKKFGVSVSAKYQKSFSDVAFPFDIATARLGFYLESAVLKKAMLLRIGTDAWAISTNAQIAFQPEMHSFYFSETNRLQQTYSVDFYVSARVKRSSFFIKYEALDALWQTRKSLVNFYGLPGSAIKVGINWVFMDYPIKKDTSPEQ